MTALHIREYVCPSTIGDGPASLALMNALRVELAGLYKAQAIEGAAVHTVRSAAQIEEARIDAASVEAVTGGRYPFVWVTVTFEPEVLPEEKLRELEEKFGFVGTKSHIQRPHWER